MYYFARLTRFVAPLPPKTIEKAPVKVKKERKAPEETTPELKKEAEKLNPPSSDVPKGTRRSPVRAFFL
jgi:hypothetical protein